MLQRVLAESGWKARMTAADAHGLTPLIWGHVNPDGVFDFDMERRLDVDLAETLRLRLWREPRNIERIVAAEGRGARREAAFGAGPTQSHSA